MDNKRVADYFVVAGLPDNPVPIEEFSNESVMKQTHKLDPIVDIAVINRSFGEEPPPKFKCISFTSTGFPADLNHGSIRAPEMYLCYRRGRDKPPLVDIGVLYEGKDSKERVLPGCEIVSLTPYGKSANVNNSGNTRIYVTFRRASSKASCDTLAVTDIQVFLLNKGEIAPHSYCTINKTLNKGMMGSDVYLCYKKSMAKSNCLSYKPVILGRYPLEDIPGLPFPERVAMFCLPMGATIECWPADNQRPAPVFSTFILTAGCDEKVYGAAVTFHESLDEDKLDDSQRKLLKMDDPESKTENAANDVVNHDVSHVTERTVQQNKCICLLSRSPFFDTFRQFLAYLYRMTLNGTHPVPIERHIAHFLNEVPQPSPQRPRIMIQLSTTALTLSQPDETPLPKSGASFIEILKNLGPTNCVSLLLCALMEQKILIHSLRPAVLTSVAEAVAAMIFPFHWQCPYIPLCPLSLSYVLNSPTPFIVGIDSQYFDMYDPPSDVTCVDLDTNTLTLSEERKSQTVKMFPKKPVKVLRSSLERLFEQLSHSHSLMSGGIDRLGLDDDNSDQDLSSSKKEIQLETSIREVYLRFMAVILKGYNSYLLPITNAPTIGTTDVNSLFDILGFMKSRDKAYHKFYSLLMRTQAFSRFIEERSFVSDKDSCLAFFDECLDKVDENKDEPRLIELEDPLQSSERTVFIMPAEPEGLPLGATYTYSSFPTLNPDLFPQPEPADVAQPASAGVKWPASVSTFCPYSPMARRTQHEIKASQKIALKHANVPAMWAKCLAWHCYSIWFIHLAAYVKTVHSKSKALRSAYDVLVAMQSARLQPPDEVCYRVLMQLCGLYHQPILAVKVLFEMKRQGIQPNAITYGFYNKAVLESKWPTSNGSAYQMWIKLRNVVMAVTQFKQPLLSHRRQSVYSNSESDPDGQSMDSYQDSELANSVSPSVNTSILVKDALRKDDPLRKRIRTNSEAGGAGHGTNEELLSTGGLSDRGYSSLSFEDAKIMSANIGSSQDSIDGPRSVKSSDRSPPVSHKEGRPKIDEQIIPTARPSHSKISNFGFSTESIITSVTEETIEIGKPEDPPVVASIPNGVSGCDVSPAVVASIPNGVSGCDLSLPVVASVPNGVVGCDVSPPVVASVPNGVSGCDVSPAVVASIPNGVSGCDLSLPVVASVPNGVVGCDVSPPVVASVPNGISGCGVHSCDNGDIAKSDSLSGTVDIVDNVSNKCDEKLLAQNGKGDCSFSETASPVEANNVDDKRIESTNEQLDDISTPLAESELVDMLSSQTLTSPVHSVRVPVTENDPLGLFNLNSAVSISASVQPEQLQTNAWNADQLAGMLFERTVENNKCSEEFSRSQENLDSTASSPVSSVANGDIATETLEKDDIGDAADTPKKHAPGTRGEMFGSALRFVGTKLASKYREVVRQSIGVKSNSGSLSSVNSAGVETSVADNVSLSHETERATYSVHDGEVAVDVIVEVQDAAVTPSRSRLKVPGLYAPLVSGIIGGIKSLQNNETLQGLASGLGQMTATMRETLADSWSMSGDVGKGIDKHGMSSSESDDLDSWRMKYDMDFSAHVQAEKGNSLGLDHSVPVEENTSEQGSTAGDQSSFRHFTGSIQSLPQSISAPCPIETEMCTQSKCSNCGNLLYDEEIMAGWSADESNLNTSCQFCAATLVPLINIYIKDYRQCIRGGAYSNLSQSTESMLSIQSSLQASTSSYKRVIGDQNSMTGAIPEDPATVDQPCCELAQTNPTLPSINSSPASTNEPVSSNGCLSSENLSENVDVKQNDEVLSAEIIDVQSDTIAEESGLSLDVTNDECSASSDLSNTLCNDAVSCSETLMDELDANSVPSAFDEILVSVNSKDDSQADLETDLGEHVIQTVSGADVPTSGCVVNTTRQSQKMWLSRDLESGSRSKVKASGENGFESRRCASECCLDKDVGDFAVGKGHQQARSRCSDINCAGKRREDLNSLVSNGSEDGKNGIIENDYMKKCIFLDPISVPYLSPLVLRKEVENVLDQEGDSCLSSMDLLDQHPIIYWNLVWYFKRLEVPSHLPSFILTAKSTNSHTVASTNDWPTLSADSSRHSVAIHSMWDNPRLHQDHGQPMYILWSQIQQNPANLVNNLQPEMFTRSVMESMVVSIMNNDVVGPLRLILNERSKCRLQTSRTRFHSIYRDMLFLSFVALGRENIDVDAFDREYKNMLASLPPQDSARLRVADRTPKAAAINCRKIFHDLEL